MIEFLTAVALAMVIEGTLYALFPNGMRRAMAYALGQPSTTMRLGGLMLAGVGVLIVWFLRG